MVEGAHKEGMAEQEKYSSRVLLHMFRHEEKLNDPGIEGEQQLLTDKGRQRSLAHGKNYPSNPTAIAIGSDIPRAQETAGFELAGAQEIKDVTGHESLEQLRAKLDKERVLGTVIGVDPRLNFRYNTPKYREAGKTAFDNKRVLDFMVNESDALAEKLGDKDSTTYDRAASRISELLEKYVHVSKNYDTLIKDHAKAETYGKVLERYLGSHLGAVDLFLTKVVEKVKGVAERNKLMQALKGHGFDYREGFDVQIDILPGQDEPQIRIIYEKKDPEGKEVLFSFNEVVPKEILRQMVEDGKIKE
jgi:broad specificity phosphatase PhoE